VPLGASVGPTALSSNRDRATIHQGSRHARSRGKRTASPIRAMGELVPGPSGRRTPRASRRRGSARRRRRRELRISRRAGATDTAHDARNGHDEQPSDRRLLGPLVRPGDAVATSAFVAPEQTRPSRNRPRQDLASPGVGGAPPALELTDAADNQQERSRPARTCLSPHGDPEESSRVVTAVGHQTGLVPATLRVTAGSLSSPRHVARGLRRRGLYLEACPPVDVQRATTV
jgi:hypothetical protein